MTRERKIQLLLWSYFWLLIFEGALRKWILPGLSNPLLVVRDPICILAIVIGWPYLFYSVARFWVLSIWGISSFALIAGVLAGHGDVITALFGARILFLHFPIIFLFGAVFSREDIWKFARFTMILALPMTILIAAQFSLPPEHFLNIAPGGEGTAAFAGALDKMRPPGVFSFISGLANFYGLAAAFWAGWLVCGPRPMPIWFWPSATAMIIALPLSISRTVLFLYLLVSTSTLLAIFFIGRKLQAILIAVLTIPILFVAISQFSIFRESTEVFIARWENAEETEGDGIGGILANRIGGPILESFHMAKDVGLLGKGIGLSTNVGSVRATGERAFIVAEGAWPATIGELGPLLGITFLIWRLTLAIRLFILAYVQALQKNMLPLILSGVVLSGVVLGQTSQPTNLGFIVVCAGFMLAACNCRISPIIYKPSDDHF
jgi:hypothetical protein